MIILHDIAICYITIGYIMVYLLRHAEGLAYRRLVYVSLSLSIYIYTYIYIYVY